MDTPNHIAININPRRVVSGNRSPWNRSSTGGESPPKLKAPVFVAFPQASWPTNLIGLTESTKVSGQPVF